MMRSGESGRRRGVISTASRGADGRADDDVGYRVIKGRRWRISDPAIPETLRQALVGELMAARRAVGRAGRDDDAPSLARARARVQDAKVALGERGPRWWLPRDEDDHRARAIAATRALLRARDGAAPPSPADIARVVDGAHWRRRLALVRGVLFDLAAAGEIDVRQRGARVDGVVRGPISLARGRGFPAPPEPA